MTCPALRVSVDVGRGRGWPAAWNGAPGLCQGDAGRRVAVRGRTGPQSASPAEPLTDPSIGGPQSGKQTAQESDGHSGTSIRQDPLPPSPAAYQRSSTSLCSTHSPQRRGETAGRRAPSARYDYRARSGTPRRMPCGHYLMGCSSVEGACGSKAPRRTRRSLIPVTTAPVSWIRTGKNSGCRGARPLVSFVWRTAVRYVRFPCDLAVVSRRAGGGRLPPGGWCTTGRVSCALR